MGTENSKPDMELKLFQNQHLQLESFKNLVISMNHKMCLILMKQAYFFV
jgi:hypothetical protein